MSVIVNLKKDWFAPDGSIYERKGNPHEFPEAWAEKPEQQEDESDEDFKTRQKKQPYAVLPSTATVVEGGKVVEVFHKTANGDTLVVPTAIEDDVKSVGNTIGAETRSAEDHDKAHQSQTVAAAAKAADGDATSLGGRPRESGPLPPGKK